MQITSKPQQVEQRGWEFEQGATVGAVRDGVRYNLDVGDTEDWFFGPRHGIVSSVQANSNVRARWQSLRYQGA